MASNFKETLKDIQAEVGPDGAGYSEEEVLKMSPDELWDKYLEWNGVIGYADQLKTAFQAIFNVEVK